MDDYLLENSYLVRRRLKRKKCWVNAILAKRNEFGEFHHLWDDLKKDEKKFFDYYRMNQNTFNYILDAIREEIKKMSNFRETISPEERLSVTLRYLATGSSFKTLGYSFRMSDVTVGRIVHETCNERMVKKVTVVFFSHSNLCAKLENGGLGVKRHRSLPGTNIKVPHVLLGDEAYPLKTYLMRPFPVSKLGPTEIIFNERLSRARQVVECAFGIMSSKWRLLQKSIEVHPKSADKLIQCICLLHNIIIDREGEQQVACNFKQDHTDSKTERFGTLGENRGTSSAYDSPTDKFVQLQGQ
ncbi:hypothetical protein NQ318_023242 [Aromia moschata]|uniref:DDE Tnp4 domain-containing protein n=1 Tax=Aromia moschata TaxID=1265417 RepID=A0AAV8XN70_9CUCU|nr:hypothetical protein NQ318_023242 [Aromia moschata]